MSLCHQAEQLKAHIYTTDPSQPLLRLPRPLASLSIWVSGNAASSRCLVQHHSLLLTGCCIPRSFLLVRFSCSFNKEKCSPSQSGYLTMAVPFQRNLMNRIGTSKCYCSQETWKPLLKQKVFTACLILIKLIFENNSEGGLMHNLIYVFYKMTEKCFCISRLFPLCGSSSDVLLWSTFVWVQNHIWNDIETSFKYTNK